MGTNRHGRIVAGLVLLALAAFLFTSLATHEPGEGPFPDYSSAPVVGNACGMAGAYVSAYALALIGWAAYAVAVAVGVAAFLLIFRVPLSQPVIRVAGLGLSIVAAVLGLAILNAGPAVTAGSYTASPGMGGGALGILLVSALYKGVGPTGSLILFVFSLCVGVFLLAGNELALLYARVAPLLGRRRGAERRAPILAQEAGTADELIVDGAEPAPELMPVTVAASAEEVADEEDLESDVGMEDDEQYAEPELITRFTPPAAVSDDDGLAELLGERPTREHTEYELPPVDLLGGTVQFGGEVDEEEIRDKGRVLERTLREFKVEARVVGIMRGPVITMYELSLAPGTKVSKVESLSDDLAIALKAPNVRIVAPLPGRNTVGIEIPNTEREVVGMRELMEQTMSKAKKMAIPLFLGKDTAGSPLVLDLARCPHLLVAGATGSGKSVAMNAMIASILMTCTPDQVQLLLVDPKSVEFGQCHQLPHLICPVLTDMKKAASVLKWACKKMDQRYALLSQVGVRDLSNYNKLGEEEIDRRLNPDGDAVLDDVPFHMPHIVIIIDEFGELMMVAAKEVESSVIRLSQKARAVGIHLICATQRPSVDVITGLIKANLPARIAFQVASKVDSRTILDRNGADLLLGRGDMLLLPPGSSSLVRAQGAFVDEEDLERVIEFLEEQGAPQFRAELREVHAQDGSGNSSDDLYDEAVRVVVENQRGSVSLLQRRLSIGYSRAARLIDIMAEAGVVGPYSGSQARKVLMSMDEWEAAHAQAAGK